MSLNSELQTLTHIQSFLSIYEQFLLLKLSCSYHGISHEFFSLSAYFSFDDIDWQPSFYEFSLKSDEIKGKFDK